MKWETVKQKVIDQVYFRILRAEIGNITTSILMDLALSEFQAAKGLRADQIRQAYADKAVEVLRQWDVRAVGRLRELFPWAFPPSLSKGTLTVFMDDSPEANWCVEIKR